MSFPTGMGTGTGLHYQNVAAQMDAYLNHGSGRFRTGPHQFEAMGGQRFPSPPFGGGPQLIHGNPLVANDVGGFGRTFMRNLFH